MASNRKKSRMLIWLTKWDKVKAHDTLTDWCTGREWPLNCVTIISAWWRSNMPFQRLSGRLNYYITRWRQEVSELESDELETRCGRESTTQQKGPWASGWAALENKKDTTLMTIRVGVNMLQFCSVSNSLSRANLTIKWDIYFFKEVFARLYSLRQYVSCVLHVHVYMCICICMYMSIVVAYDYTTQRAVA